jgi:hypothetical protein
MTKFIIIWFRAFVSIPFIGNVYQIIDVIYILIYINILF